MDLGKSVLGRARLKVFVFESEGIVSVKSMAGLVEASKLGFDEELGPN